MGTAMNRGTGAARDVDPDAWDLRRVRTLLRRVYREHERDDNFACHCAVMALYAHLRLVRLIVPQHPLWTVNPYRRCDFRCTYCSVNAQGAAVPVLTGDALRRRLRLELQIVPADHHTALSSMCDAYVPAEVHLGVARIAIEELIAAGRCVHVVTKGPTVLRDADLLRRARCGRVEVSLCTLDQDRAARLEPGAASPAERLALVRRLADEGVDVGVMVAPWIPGVTNVAAVLAAAGPERRITISPLKCNADGAKLTLASRTYTQESVNRRYREERERFRGATSLRWEAPWRFDDHYSSRYLPMTFEEVDGIVRSPDPAPTPAQRLAAMPATEELGSVRRAAPAGSATYQRAVRGHGRTCCSPREAATPGGLVSSHSRTSRTASAGWWLAPTAVGVATPPGCSTCAPTRARPFRWGERGLPCGRVGQPGPSSCASGPCWKFSAPGGTS